MDPSDTEVIVRADSAGCTRAFLEACRGHKARFCVGHKLSIDIAQIITQVPDKCWHQALSADGSELRDQAEVAEITALADLSNYPEGTRMIARREHPHPGAQLSFCDSAGRRLQVPRDQFLKIRYFTARISARPDDPQQANRQDAYLQALATLPLVEIHYGHFLTKPVRMQRANRRPGESRTVEVLRIEEKGSDVNLATYLLFDAFKRHCDTAIVISNDSDLAQAIQITQSELGVKVGIINPQARKTRSRKLLSLNCSFYKQVPRQLLPETLLPVVVDGPNGPIHKPKDW